MTRDSLQVPDSIKLSLRKMMLGELQHTSSLSVYELELFEWYLKETESVLNEMRAAEYEYIQEQIDSGREDINDSGIVPIEYYLKRVRCSHVIYLASLLESFLEEECQRLTAALGSQNIPFKLTELKGDQWTKKKKFLEGYGRFGVRNDVWVDIKAMILLRNYIVHDNGIVNPLKPDVQALLRQPGISLSGFEVVVETEYVDHAFKTFKRLCKHIEAEITELIARTIHPVSIK